MTKPYRYYRDANGTDEEFAICDSMGCEIVCIPFWDAEAEAEATAKLIVDALNAYQPEE